MVPSQKSSKAANTACVVLNFKVTPCIPVSRDFKTITCRILRFFLPALPVEHNWLLTQIVWETDRLGGILVRLKTLYMGDIKNNRQSTYQTFYLSAYGRQQLASVALLYKWTVVGQPQWP